MFLKDSKPLWKHVFSDTIFFCYYKYFVALLNAYFYFERLISGWMRSPGKVTTSCLNFRHFYSGKECLYLTATSRPFFILLECLSSGQMTMFMKKF